MPPPHLYGDHHLPVHGSDGEVIDPGHISSSDLLPPVKEEVFDKLYEEAMRDSLSSEGELSDIANRERSRSMLSKVPATVPTVVKSESSASCVLSDWPGEFQFNLGFPEHTKPRDPQYSHMVNKLYICQNSNITLNLLFSSPPDNKSFSLNAAMVFTSPDHSLHPVTVCYQHSHTSAGRLKDPLASHLLRVSRNLVDSKYFQFGDTGKHLVVLEPLSSVAGPALLSQVTLKFTDLGSCPGGINRRDTAVVFNLEVDGVCVGRRVLPVRVCTCPKRDRVHDEKSEMGRNNAKGSIDKQPSGEEKFWILANGKDNYEALRKVGELFEKNKCGDVVEWGEEVDKMNKKARLDIK